ncbi:MAG: hypothetical protein HY699_07675 [Deltaproteobacteria bacterium]|nr:hypothetical protein [Deltaproteobacteria bacterium]
MIAAVVGLGCASVALMAMAQDAPSTPRIGRPNPEVLQALAEVRKQYGADAVMLEGFLMGHAIESGAVRETAVTVSGIQEYRQKRYLTFTLDSGIVYNDRELGADERLGRTWTRIVEPTLRRFRGLDLRADGLGLWINYTHKPYTDEADLRAHLSQGAGEPEAALFYLLTSDLAELYAARITGQQLAERASVLVNGVGRSVRVEAAEPTPPAPSR